MIRLNPCVFMPSLALALAALSTPAALSGQEPRAIPESALRILRGHSETAYQTAFSPDGTLLATASFDRTIRIWRVADGAQVASLSGHGGKVLCIAFSSDGRSLLSGSEDKTVKLWSVPLGGPGKLAGHSAPVRALALSADGRRLASGGDDRTVRIWDRAAGKEELKIEGLPGAALALAFDAGGERIAAACADGSLHLYAIAAPPPPAAAGTAADLIRAGEGWRYQKGTAAPPADWAKLGFDDAQWASGDSGFGYSSTPEELATVKTQLPDMANGFLTLFIRKGFKVADPKAVEKLSLRLILDDGFVAYLNGAEVARQNVEGSPPGHDTPAAAATEPSEVVVDLGAHIAKLVAGDNVLAIQGHNAATTSSDFVLTPSLSAVLKSAEAKPEPAVKPGAEIIKIENLGEPVQAAALSPDGKRIASAGAAGAIRIHSLEDGAELAKLQAPGGAVKGIAFLNDGAVAAAGADGAIRVFGIADGKEMKSLAGHQGAVNALALSLDRKVLASGGEDKTVRLWDPEAGKELRSLAGHQGPVLAVAFSPDGQTVVSGSADRTLKAWKAADGAALGSFDHESEVRAAATAGGRYYSAGPGSEILDWRVESADALKTFTGHGGLVHAVAFSPDGRLAASGGADKTVRLWNLADGKEARSINAHDSSVYCLAFSPDGQLIASGGFDKLVKVWKVADGTELKKLEGHEEGVFSLAFSADGKSIISGSSDRSVRVWSLEEGKAIHVLAGHPGWVMDLRLLPGKPRVISADYAGNILIWDLAEGKQIAHVKVPAVVHGFSVSPDGNWAATANSDSTIFLFETPPEAR